MSLSEQLRAMYLALEILHAPDINVRDIDFAQQLSNLPNLSSVGGNNSDVSSAC
jgi:hypothetical protein